MKEIERIYTVLTDEGTDEETIAGFSNGIISMQAVTSEKTMAEAMLVLAKRSFPKKDFRMISFLRERDSV